MLPVMNMNFYCNCTQLLQMWRDTSLQILFAAEGQAGHHLPPSHQPVDLLTPDGQQPGNAKQPMLVGAT